MTAEEMGKLSKRLRVTFAVISVAFVVILAISPVKDYFREWKGYQKEYVRFAQTRPNTKRLLADFHPGIDQIWIPEMRVEDRCTTCHQGISEQGLAGRTIPQPFRAHPAIPHRVKEWGCVVCHRGQGPATEAAEAHETTLAWEQPLLPTHYIQAACGSCHQEDIPQTPRLNRGRELLTRLNCVGCHRMENIERPTKIGPGLSNVGNKVSREWIYKWLKAPRTIVDDNGNTKVDGYETGEEPRMPQFRLSEQELRELSAYLISLKDPTTPAYSIDRKVIATWEHRPDLVDQGSVRFRQTFCTTCHALAVTRAGETKMIGGDIGPELSKVGSKVSPDWLVAWLRDPKSLQPHTEMPRYQWSDEDLYKVSRYILSSLTDPDLLSDVPKMDAPSATEIQSGGRIFTEKGCASCHVVPGVNPQKEFGPDLSNIGSKNVSQLEFGNATIPRNLVSYIQAKITNPLSVNSAARMPQYHLTGDDLDAVTTALLSMAGPPPSSARAQLVVPRTRSEFRPAGEFGKLFERYQCAVCHRFNGSGGLLAPDLSFEGSRAQRQWMVNFLKNPQTLRPTLTFRMPQFNITDREAAVIADYLAMVLQSPAVDLDEGAQKPIPAEGVAYGKQLYEVKYQCQSCHTIGAGGGYVGPNLNNAGNWLNPGWIRAWLKNPQALIPGAIEPRRTFSDQEIQALTGYLMTLRQSDKPTTVKRPVAAAGGSR
jgi:mono/diheme cytochrome c family protein